MRVGLLGEDGRWGCVVTSLVALGPHSPDASASQTRRNQRVNFVPGAGKWVLS